MSTRPDAADADDLAPRRPSSRCSSKWRRSACSVGAVLAELLVHAARSRERRPIWAAMSVSGRRSAVADDSMPSTGRELRQGLQAVIAYAPSGASAPAHLLLPGDPARAGATAAAFNTSVSDTWSTRCRASPSRKSRPSPPGRPAPTRAWPRGIGRRESVVAPDREARGHPLHVVLERPR
jgi:hypothetical protein